MVHSPSQISTLFKPLTIFEDVMTPTHEDIIINRDLTQLHPDLERGQAEKDTTPVSCASEETKVSSTPVNRDKSSETREPQKAMIW
jgi:hypothetical protein